MRLPTLTGLCAAALLGAPGAWGASDTSYANFAFATELGSGIYELHGQTLQVYTLQPAHWLRDTTRPGARPGIKLIFPVTIGFLDYKSEDLLEFQLPTSVGAISFEPGVQLDFWLDEDWHVYPYAKAGGTYSSTPAANALIYGLGIRSDMRFSIFDGADMWRSELLRAGVHYTHQGAVQADGTVLPLPDDAFTRWRNGVELRHRVGPGFSQRRAEIGVYAMIDLYSDTPSGPVTGISTRTVQYEEGLVFGTNPTWQLWGIPVPRIGIGYRQAGSLTGWRIVFGDPF
ncbi:MAG TPA: hypothetical protein VGI91_02655 [Steroidobacteraceae bacterium]